MSANTATFPHEGKKEQFHYLQGVPFFTCTFCHPQTVAYEQNLDSYADTSASMTCIYYAGTQKQMGDCTGWSLFSHQGWPASVGKKCSYSSSYTSSWRCSEVLREGNELSCGSHFFLCVYWWSLFRSIVWSHKKLESMVWLSFHYHSCQCWNKKAESPKSSFSQR